MLHAPRLTHSVAVSQLVAFKEGSRLSIYGSHSIGDEVPNYAIVNLVFTLKHLN